MSGKIESLKVVEDQYNGAKKKVERRIIVCAGTGCMANGALKVFSELEKEIKARNIYVTLELDYEDKKKDHETYISKSGCQGFCQMGPLVTILPENLLYTKVTVNDVVEIVEKTIVGNETIDRLLYRDPVTAVHCKGTGDIPFYTKQERLILKQCGTLNPEDIKEYIGHMQFGKN